MKSKSEPVRTEQKEQVSLHPLMYEMIFLLIILAMLGVAYATGMSTLHALQALMDLAFHAGWW